MKSVLPILLLACPTACARPSTTPLALSPALPALTAGSTAPCRPLPRIPSNDIAAVAATMAQVAQLYGACAIRHAAVVNAYAEARGAIARWQGRFGKNHGGDDADPQLSDGR